MNSGLGAEFRRQREIRGLPLHAAAHELGLEGAFLWRLENGTKAVTHSVLARVCEHYGISLVGQVA